VWGKDISCQNCNIGNAVIPLCTFCLRCLFNIITIRFFFFINMFVSHMRHTIYFVSFGLFLLNVCNVSTSYRLRGYACYVSLIWASFSSWIHSMTNRVIRNYSLTEVFVKGSQTFNILVMGIRKINLILCHSYGTSFTHSFRFWNCFREIHHILNMFI
jgi:hypothetical protein